MYCPVTAIKLLFGDIFIVTIGAVCPEELEEHCPINI
jgi:hypothetical protein